MTKKWKLHFDKKTDLFYIRRWSWAWLCYYYIDDTFPGKFKWMGKEFIARNAAKFDTEEEAKSFINIHKIEMKPS